MGPNAAAQQFIDPAILGNPQPESRTPASTTTLVELVTLEGDDSRQVHQAVDRAHQLAVAGAESVRRSVRARLSDGLLVLPGIGWLLAVLPRSRC